MALCGSSLSLHTGLTYEIVSVCFGLLWANSKVKSWQRETGEITERGLNHFQVLTMEMYGIVWFVSLPAVLLALGGAAPLVRVNAKFMVKNAVYESLRRQHTAFLTANMTLTHTSRAAPILVSDSSATDNVTKEKNQSTVEDFY